MYLEDVARNVRRVEEAATNEGKPITETFPARPSREQIVPIIAALVNDVERIFQVNIPNAAQIIKGFPDDVVVECPAVVSGAGIRGVSVPAFPRKVMAGAMIPRWERAELAVEAARSGDRDILLTYLLHDPRTRSLEQAENLIREWLADPRNEAMARLFK
jgi:alpha-galactosidase